MILHYVTHPQVAIDPTVPVPRWGLSERGRERARAAARCRWMDEVGRIVSSDETKAIETAEILVEARGMALAVRPGLHENDRSATGFLPPPEFEATADRFFAEPETSVRGWERAVDVADRVERALAATLAEAGGAGDLLLVGHGAAGTLLWCRLVGLPIDRAQDQPAGGGHRWTFDLAQRRAVAAWRPFEIDDAA
ncbi:MAG: phosphoglycerate mutase family protein [Hyphomicrobiales bacterium]|nr:phosphoglycerate mutase family protein [Hyphomicrobiales bacterium]